MVTQQKHTPGPWAVGGHPGDKSGTDWREVLAPSQFGPAYVCQALKEDARLIAAAPDLLAACEVALRNAESRLYILPLGAPDIDRQALHAEAALYRAAIAKARA